MHDRTRTSLRIACLAVLLTLVVVAGAAASTMMLGSSPEIPGAEGKVSLKLINNQNTGITLSVKHLAPPERIAPGAAVIVVWVRGLESGALAQNLGALRVNRNLSGNLRAITALRAFDLFMTAEPAQSATAPTGSELLPLHYTGK